jgi:hypothetical protein
MEDPLRMPRLLRGSRGWLLLTLVIAVAGILLRFWLYREPANTDDVQYISDASAACSGGDTANSLRIAFQALPFVSVQLFGYSLEAYYASVYSHALISVLGLVVFASVLSGTRAAALVTLFWATSVVCIQSDTRLLPDNLGAAFALLAIAALAKAGGIGVRPEPRAAPASGGRRPLALGFLAGLLFWAAVSTRASFAAFGLAGLGVLALSRDRWRLLGSVALGGALGLGLELAYFQACYGDAWTRFAMLTAYPGKISGGRPFQGYSLESIVTRYPRMLASANGAELAFYLAGCAGAVSWALRWREKTSVVKLCALLGPFGLIAFALASWDPPVPLMREKLRYYASVVPLFYLATSDLLLWAVDRIRRAAGAGEEAGPTGAGLRVRRAAAAVVLAVLVLGVLSVVWGNFHAALDDSHAVRKGGGFLFRVARAIRSDAEGSNRPRLIYDDVRTSRVLKLMLPARDGWRHVPLEPPERITEPGYMLLNWHRLYGNRRYGYREVEDAHTYPRSIEHLPLLRRWLGFHHFEIFLAYPIERRVTDLTPRLPPYWSRAVGKVPRGDTDPRETGSFTASRGHTIYKGHAGSRALERFGLLPSGRYVELVLAVRASRPSTLRATLRAWPLRSGGPTPYRMGDVVVDAGVPEAVFWAYLPTAARNLSFVVRVRDGEVAIEGTKVYALETHRMEPVKAR